MDAERIYSELWGESGERWTPESRLPDFSHAGYHSGEADLPRPSVVLNVRDFGATGDGQTDDTEAFKAAIEACERGAVFIPAGRYHITDILEIEKSGVVLRGAGPEKTTLFFSKPLNEVRPHWSATTGGRKTSHYSWAGGFIWISGDYQTEEITRITAPVDRGAQLLKVASSARLSPGQRVEISLHDNGDQSLVSYLYSGDPGDIANSGPGVAVQIVTITAVEDEVIHLDRPLRFTVLPDWNPVVRRYAPTVSEVGVEDLSFEFPVEPYMGHFTELGYNPLAMSSVEHCWVRNVRILNCDSGFFIRGNFNTLTDLEFATDRQPDERGRTGHHGFYIGGSDNFLTRFSIGQRFIHDISIGKQSVGTVVSNGSGDDLALDHHKHTPYENLFTNLDAGAGTRVWMSGGGGALGKHCAARGTFWNIRASQNIPWPPEVFGPWSMNFVGLTSDAESRTERDGPWYEMIEPDKLSPANLHEAQLRRRLKKGYPN